jgi:hypothetical protein
MKITDKGVEDILNVMTGVTSRAIISGNQSLKSRNIATLLFGLKNMHSDKKIIRDLLTEAFLMIEICNDSFSN